VQRGGVLQARRGVAWKREGGGCLRIGTAIHPLHAGDSRVMMKRVARNLTPVDSTYCVYTVTTRIHTSVHIMWIRLGFRIFVQPAADGKSTCAFF